MPSTLRVLVPPARPAVSLATVRQHVRVDNTGDDQLLALYTETATATAEMFLSRALITQTLSWSSGEAPGLDPSTLFSRGILPYGLSHAAPLIGARPLELPRSPVQEILSVALSRPLTGWPDGDTAAIRVMDPASYRTELSSDPALLRFGGPAFFGGLGRAAWGQAVTITFMAGYGATEDLVPAPIRQAILMQTASLYENRGDVASELSDVATRLMYPYRIVSFG